MDKKFNLFITVSIIFHAFLVGLIVYFISKKSFSFKIKEKETVISVKRITTKNFTINRKNFKADKSSSYKTAMHTEDNIKDITIINKEIDISLNKNDNNLTIKENTINSIKFKEKIPDILNNEDFSSFDVEEELESLNSEGISFLDGESRNLLDSRKKEFKSLNLQTNTNCKIKIHIVADGSVEYAEIIESTGSLEKDNAILSIIKKWKFEKSVKNVQIAQVEIKYYLK